MNFKLDQLFTSPFIHCSIENWEFNKRRILYSLPEDTKNNLSSLHSKNNHVELGSDNLYVSIDFEKFKNHSNNPNISFGGVATRNIAKGEELTYDYKKIDSDYKDF